MNGISLRIRRRPGTDGQWDLGTFIINVEPTVGKVPEPGSILPTGAGLALMGITGLRRNGPGETA